MLEPQVKSVPTTCPLGMIGGGPHTIATEGAKRHWRTSGILPVTLNNGLHSSPSVNAIDI